MFNPLKLIGKGVKFVGGDLVEGVVDILKETGIVKDPEQERKAKEALLNYSSNVIGHINETMRAEAKSEHWAQWLWRPVVGFTFSAVIINNYILMPWFPQLQPIVVPPQLWITMLTVLGVAAGTRGVEKWQKAKNGK